MRASFVVWTHGGSYLVGKHFAPLVRLEAGLRARGFHIISHSYRLGSQAHINGSFADWIDAVVCFSPSILVKSQKGLIEPHAALLHRYLPEGAEQMNIRIVTR